MFVRWWLDDPVSLTGEVRAVFYAGLLLLCILDHPSPLHAATIILRTHPALYTPVGLMRVLRVRWVPPAVLRIISSLTVIAWVAAACGFLQPLSACATFLGFFFLHGVNAGALGSNHSTHVALYALFCMCFSVSHDTCSLDRALASPWLPLFETTGAFASGFASKLLLVLVVYIMVAAGLAKLRCGGLVWLNGAALRYYIADHATCARSPRLARFLIARPALCCVIASATVALELSSIFALWDSTLRLPFVCAWICFHVGIFLVMTPSYWVQIWCYVPLLNWDHLSASGAAVPSQPLEPSLVHDWGETVFAFVGWSICISLSIVMLRRSEYWPLTSVPMYSNAITPAREWPSCIGDLKRRADAAWRGDAQAWKHPWVPSEAWEGVWAVPADGGRPVWLFYLMAKQPKAKFVRWSQFAKVTRHVAIADFASRASSSNHDTLHTADGPVTRFLSLLTDIARRELPDWHAYERLEFVCRCGSGWVIVSRSHLCAQAAVDHAMPSIHENISQVRHQRENSRGARA